ncbi:aminotransferase class III-fold pyridoxal phosphate-dependent enzyme [Streptomyces sp. NPDC006458]|uniref:aminotransferase class III-fold pyridoxal phosphate-dependent enzyme n=1 Tax=Streptomyces sp. NPDC006458 TaxID=3154302 RepID=UPI0033BD4515
MSRLRTAGGRRTVTVTEETPRSRTARESAARTYAQALPIVPVRARGLTIEGADGRRYLDCLSGAGTLALGHNHPVVLEAIRKVLDSGAPLHVPDLGTPVEDGFVAELLHTLPPGLADHARVRFCGPSRASALDEARRVVRAATGRTEVPALAPTAAAFGPRLREATRPDGTPTPDPGSFPPHEAELTAPWPESARPAGVIVEAVRGDDEVGPTPDAWTRAVGRLASAQAVPLIADETETGVGRTGVFWAVEHSGVTPDLMILSKAIGGSLPLSLVVHHTDLEPGAPAPTVRGNQLAMAAGTATLAYVREHQLAERAAVLGHRMLTHLGDLARRFPCIAGVRGRGLMTGVEFLPAGAGAWPGAVAEHAPGPATGLGVSAAALPPGPATRPGPGPDPRRAAAAELAVAVQRECLSRGLIVGLTGTHSNVVRLLPPLTISDEQAAAVLDRLSDAVETVACHPVTDHHRGTSF